MDCFAAIRKPMDFAFIPPFIGPTALHRKELMQRARSVRQLMIAKRQRQNRIKPVKVPWKVAGVSGPDFWEFFDSLPRDVRNYLNNLSVSPAAWHDAYQGVLRRYWRG